jgi:hypothetical protein
MSEVRQTIAIDNTRRPSPLVGEGEDGGGTDVACERIAARTAAVEVGCVKRSVLSKEGRPEGIRSPHC